MDSLITFEKLAAKHLPYLYEIRFSVEENPLHPHQIQYLQRTQALDDINQGGGRICKYGEDYAGVGFGLFIPEPLIGGLFVKPEYQSKGIGSALLNAVTAWLFDNGAEEIHLTTDLGSRAEVFYQRRGWVAIGKDEFGQAELVKRKGDK
ncbi:GNAT family N-acetyltransferase [Serratia proteamaculans]|uniref:GNAT family N-acetyltransferase n=1 Tax=Serratia proteamaculans TaxID=28151 RepID=UPI000D8A344D|nr:GNAT family N-acetyltransferase [Serratia proteamaculans]SPZ55416.1 Acetyltransferase (GNAT) family [Serratia quinivorans]CAI1212347.1 Acetyltransferase (GNAT) family [Serratia proteamaculans]CAI1223331.1 Acetyltransferase (GNAT) family [Serratia proteamaculans]CAI1227901.1 Acetyltransferase (GNAT) family [Serratia proteamaculans]CAI2009280.1 Acetyltransferase (GNAT) family [Serratia proteamaculans]